MKKKIISLMTVMMMAVSLFSLPMPAMAYSSTVIKWTEGVAGGAIYFDESTGTITDCDDTVTEAVIPGKINGVSVTSIGDSAFYGCDNLASITIPDGVTSIRDDAFRNCDNLASITIPDSVTSIGDDAFSFCHSLKSITIPDGVTSIGAGAFFGCWDLASITIPDGVTSIRDDAFRNCDNLASITIPDSVTSIGDSAFYGCDNLASITIPDGVTSIGDSAFSGCDNLASITIPDGVTSIGDDAFSFCHSLKSITIPDGVTSIGDDAFSGCDNLASITIPDGVTSIGAGAFSGCDNLASITIPDGVTSIGDDAFSFCYSLKSITIPDGVTSIGDSAFYACHSLKSITIPDGVTSIGAGAFSGCDNLASITVATENKEYFSKEGVLFNKDRSKLVQYPMGNSRKKYDIPAGVTSIGDSAFYGCDNLASITIPDGVTSIGAGAFYGCDNLARITIPDGVTSIGAGAFSSCDNLASITIPDGVTSIGDDAFSFCYSLKSITIPASVTSIGADAFHGYANLTTVYGYSGSYAETYAKERNISFIVIGSSKYKPVNDVDISGSTGGNIGGSTDVDTVEMKLFENASGSVGDQPIAKFFPGDYSLDFPFVKTKIIKESMEDGTYKLKAAIGVNENIAFGSEKGWENLKKDVNDARDRVNKTERLSSMVRKWGAASGSFNIVDKFDFGKKPEMEVVGYYEAIFDENGKLITDSGGMVVGAKWDASVAQQCVFAPVPVPFYVELGGSLSAKGQGGLSRIFTKGTPEISGQVMINPGLFAGAGVGITGVAAVGVRGKGGLEMQVIPASRGAFTAGISIRAQLMFIFEQDIDIAEATYPLWGTTSRMRLYNSEPGNPLSTRNNAMKLVERGYQDKTTEWNGGLKKAMSRTTQSSASVLELQDYIMPNTIPRMKKIGNDTVMVFQSNDASRSTANSVKLMYSVYDGTSWSEPKALWDNGTLDAFADLEVINGELYVAWQKCKGKVTETEPKAIAEQLAAKNEICCSKYDSKAKQFTEAKYITNDNAYDMKPVLVQGDKPSVIWASSNSNDINAVKGTKAIKASGFDGNAWSKPTVLGTTENYICEMDGSYNNGKLEAVFNEVDADNKQSVVKAAAGTTETLISDMKSPVYGLSCEHGRMNYNQNGVLNQYNFEDGTTSVIKAGESGAISSNSIIASNGGKATVLWMKNDDNGCTFYSSVKCADGSYSDPVEVYNNENVTGSFFTAALDDAGDWEIVFSATDAADTEKNTLFFVKKKSLPKLEMEDVIINENECNDSEQPISYTVTNNSEEGISSFNLKVASGSTEYLNKTVGCSIKPGEAAYFEDFINAENLTVDQNLTVQVIAENQIDLEETAATKKVISNDLGLSVEKLVLADKVQFTATVTNTGKVPADGVLSFYADKTDKNLIATEKVGALNPGESKEITFTQDYENMNFDKDGTAYYLIDLNTGNEESTVENNQYYGVFYDWEKVKTDEKITISDDNVALEKDSWEYTGTPVKPQVIVSVGGEKLTEGEDYALEYKNNIEAGKASVKVAGIGSYTGTVTKYFNIAKNDAADEKIAISDDNVALEKDSWEYAGKPIKPQVIVSVGGEKLTEGEDYALEYKNNIEAGKASVKVAGIGSYTGTVTKYFNIVKNDATENKDLLFGKKKVLRIFGPTRYETSLKSADALKKSLDLDKFNTAVIATGTNYPDALTGCYLAKVKDAPILLVNPYTESTVSQYLKNNVRKGGKVYLLGGTGAIRESFEKSLKTAGYDVERLSGANRYDTNLEILKEAGVKSEDLLVCTGNGFADSLSASAAGKPILLVDRSLSAKQKAYLNGLDKNKKAYLIGGTGVVSDSFKSQLKPYASGGISRVYGDNRYKTSKAVAEAFFAKADSVVLAWAQDFPDGLSGGPLAMSMGAPLVLADNSSYQYAAQYVDKAGVKKAAVLGGTPLISDQVVNKIIQ